MSKTAERRAVKALPSLAAELRAYKRAAVRMWHERALEADRSGTPAARAYTWARYRRERAKSPAEFRAWYQSEQVQAICHTPRMQLLIPLARSRGNAVREVRASVSL